MSNFLQPHPDIAGNSLTIGMIVSLVQYFPINYLLFGILFPESNFYLAMYHLLKKTISFGVMFISRNSSLIDIISYHLLSKLNK